MTAVYQMISAFKIKSLKELKREIPIIIIEGNHDQRSYNTDRSWMDFLSNMNLIVLLDSTYNSDQQIFDFNEYSYENHDGGMIRIKDAYIYGVPYLGSITEKYLPGIRASISSKDDGYNILLMHFGIDNEVEKKLGIDLADSNLVKLHEVVDYLALGHFHKQYIRPTTDEWIFNPGSLEANDLTEWLAQYDRGAFLIKIHGKKATERTITRLLVNSGSSEENNKIPNRKFIIIPPIVLKSDLPDFLAVQEYVESFVKKQVPYRNENNGIDRDDPDFPIVSIFITGTIGFSKFEINLGQLREYLKSKFLALEIRLIQSELQSMLNGVSTILDPSAKVKDIEKDIFRQMVNCHAQFREVQEPLLDFIQEIKGTLLGAKPDSKLVKESIKNWWITNMEIESKLTAPIHTKENSKKSQKTLSMQSTLKTVAQNKNKNDSKLKMNENPTVEPDNEIDEKEEEETEIFDDEDLA